MLFSCLNFTIWPDLENIETILNERLYFQLTSFDEIFSTLESCHICELTMVPFPQFDVFIYHNTPVVVFHYLPL